MAHLTINQLTELTLRYQSLKDMAANKGLDADLHISLYGSPDEEETFDAISLRVEKDGEEDTLFWDNITDASDYGWRKLSLAFEEAERIVNEYQA